MDRPNLRRSSLPICFSIRLMDPPSSSLSCSPPAFSYFLIFLIGKTLVKTKSLGILVGGGVAGAFVFHIVTCSFAWWSNPAYAKTLNGLIQAISVGLPGFPPAYLFLKNSIVSSILFTFVMGWVALRIQEPVRSTAAGARAAGVN